jgi:hypothetical protein
VGGPGSGNRWNHRVRATCESMRRIDLRYMKRNRLLEIGRRGTLSWTYAGHAHGRIGYNVETDRLRLSYSRQSESGDWQAVEESIWFTFTKQHLGGDRRWLKCPGCGRRCSLLYGGSRFRCRGCYRLAYQSQNEAPMWRSLSQAQKLRQRLGGSGSMDEPFPPKPKGMHWTTYELLYRKGERLEGQVNAMEQVWFSQFVSGFLDRTTKSVRRSTHG